MMFQIHFSNYKNTFVKYENDITKITVLKYITKIVVQDCKIRFYKDSSFKNLLGFAFF